MCRILEMLRVKHPFVATSQDELSVQKGQVVELLQRENAWSLVRSADRTVEGYIPTAYLDSVPLLKDKSCNQKVLAIKAKTILQLEQSALEQSFRASDIFTKLSCKHKYSSAPSSPCTPKKGSEANNNKYRSKSEVASPVKPSFNHKQDCNPFNFEPKNSICTKSNATLSPKSKARRRPSENLASKSSQSSPERFKPPSVGRNRSISHDPDRSEMLMENLHKSYSCSVNGSRRLSDIFCGNTMTSSLLLSPPSPGFTPAGKINAALDSNSLSNSKGNRAMNRRSSSYHSATSPLFDVPLLSLSADRHKERRGTLDTLMAQRFGWKSDRSPNSNRRNTVTCLRMPDDIGNVCSNGNKNPEWRNGVSQPAPPQSIAKPSLSSLRPHLSICKEDSMEVPDLHSKVSCVDEEGLRDKSDDVSQTETGSSSDDETEEQQLKGEYLVVYGHKFQILHRSHINLGSNIRDDTELSISKGELVTVICRDEDDSEWVWITNDKLEEGSVPLSCLIKLTDGDDD